MYQAQVLNSSGTPVWIGNTIAATEDTSGTLSYGQTYHWQARAINTSCDWYASDWSGSQYFMTDYVPTLDEIVLRNGSSAVVSPDNWGKYNICQREFVYDPAPRRLLFRARIRDNDGEVINASAKWNGHVYPLTISDSGTANVYLGQATIDYIDSDNAPTAEKWKIQASDLYVTSAWIDSGTEWKVWDCQVPVSGTIFDGSAGQACNSTGFTTLADSKRVEQFPE